MERLVEGRAEPQRGRRVAARRKLAVERAAPARRKAAVRTDSTEDQQERLMTLSLRGSIIAAMLGMSAFFHAPLGAALAGLFR